MTAIEISTVEQLQAIQLAPDEDYVLINDIDASETESWNGGSGFVPITGFSGSLDGRGHSVNGLYVDRWEHHAGFIGGYFSGLLQRIVFQNVTIISGGLWQYCGIVSDCTGGTIEQVLVESGLIDVETGYYCGLVGRLREGGVVRDCANFATIRASGADSRIAGLIGRSESGSSLLRSYSASVIEAPGGSGAVGQSLGTVTSVYWDTQASGKAAGGGGIGKTTAEMRSIATYADWDIVSGVDDAHIWGIDPSINGGYPFLQIFHKVTPSPARRYTPFLSPRISYSDIQGAGMIQVIGKPLRWTIATYDDEGKPIDADDTPTVQLRINQEASLQEADVDKRAGTTGLYDCSATISGLAEGDHIEALAAVEMGGTEYRQPYQWRVIAAMRGTDGAMTTLGSTAPANWINAAAIASNAITAAKIANGALTAAKFAAGALESSGVGTLLERITGRLRTAVEADAADQTILAEIASLAPDTGPDVRKLTIQAHTGDDPATGEPVAGLQMRIAGRTIATDTAGLAEVRLNPGNYMAAVIEPVGFEPVAPLEITVGADDVVLPIALVAIALPSEAAPYCVTRFAVQDQFTDAAVGAAIDVAFVRFLPGATRSAVVISPAAPLVTGPGGYVDRRLNRLAEYDVTYRVPGSLPKKLRVRTPDAGSLLVVEP